MTLHCFILFLAVLLDRLFGDPAFLWRSIHHPVVLFGKLINLFDKAFNQKHNSNKQRYWLGWSTILFLLILAAGVGFFIHIICQCIGWSGVLVEALIASVFFAQKSLFQHVRAVFDAYNTKGIVGARQAVSMIVGRDPEKLDESGVASSAIESLAENTSDGIVAPVFWFLLLGLPGLFAYKMLNTADSMIAHLNERYRDFGYATAKLDDIANYVPARFTAFLVLIYVFFRSGKTIFYNCWYVIIHDARQHRSPNAGWPETAFATVLGIRLSGPRSYHGEISQEAYINEKGNIASMMDIPKALALFNKIMTIMLIIIGLLVVIFYLFFL